MACKFPYLVKNPSPTGFSHIPVPCGKCYDCKMRYCTQWAFRLLQQEKKCTSSHFITLTYENQYVPITKKGFMSLDSGKHLKNYFKTLRNQYRYRAINPKTGKKKYYYDKVPKIKYFAVGEYGGKTNRPHYHVIVFNAHEKHIVNSWPYGGVHVGTVAQSSIMYCLKYVLKDGKIPMHQNDDRIPEYRRTSIKLGLDYLTPEIIAYHRQNHLNHFITMEGGYKVGIPRYFREKIWQKEELEKINEELLVYFEKIEENLKSKHYQSKTQEYETYQRQVSEYKLTRAFNRNKKTRDSDTI